MLKFNTLHDGAFTQHDPLADAYQKIKEQGDVHVHHYPKGEAPDDKKKKEKEAKEAEKNGNGNGNGGTASAPPQEEGPPPPEDSGNQMPKFSKDEVKRIRLILKKTKEKKESEQKLSNKKDKVNTKPKLKDVKIDEVAIRKSLIRGVSGGQKSPSARNSSGIDLSRVWDKLEDLTGNTIKVSYKSSMGSSRDNEELKIGKKTSVKGVWKISLTHVDNPKGMKYFFYNRNDNVSFAVGDMAATLTSIKGLNPLPEEVDLDEEQLAGWIAVHNRKKLEIKKHEADGIYGAKQVAIKHFKIPKSKHHTLAIEPAYESYMEDVKIDEKWKKGTYTMKDGETGKVLGTFKSGAAAQRHHKRLIQKGDYDNIKVEIDEEFEIDEAWEAGTVYHQDYGGGERTYFRADVLQKNKRWKGMSVDEVGGKQKKPKNNTADETVRGWEMTSNNEIPKGLKEEVEIDEGKLGTVKLNTGDVVSAKMGKGYSFKGDENMQAYKFTNRTQAQKHAEKVGGEVIKPGRVFYVRMNEEVEIEENAKSKYQLYHKTFSGAMQHAYDVAKQRGSTVDPNEIDNKVATGPKKPSSGKTNRYILGTDTKKKLHVQVANLDNRQYELNMYIEEVNPEEKIKMENALKTFNDGAFTNNDPLKDVYANMVANYNEVDPYSGKEIDKEEQLNEVELAEKVKLECQECSKKFSKAKPTSSTRCPKCGGTDIDLAEARERPTDTRDKQYKRYEGQNEHGKAAVYAWKKYHDRNNPKEVSHGKDLDSINTRHAERGHLSHEDGQKRYNISKTYTDRMHAKHNQTEEIELDEIRWDLMDKGPEPTASVIKSVGKQLRDYAHKSGSIDKDDFLATADILLKGKLPREKQIPQDTDPREFVHDLMAKTFGWKFVEQKYGVTFSQRRNYKEEVDIEESDMPAARSSKQYRRYEGQNQHGKAAVYAWKKYHDRNNPKEVSHGKELKDINKRHDERGHLSHEDGQKRYKISKTYTNRMHGISARTENIEGTTQIGWVNELTSKFLMRASKVAGKKADDASVNKNFIDVGGKEARKRTDQSVKFHRVALDRRVKEDIQFNEDAKMGRQSDAQLKTLHTKFSSMDLSSPANKHFHKRIEKEMEKRGSSSVDASEEYVDKYTSKIDKLKQRHIDEAKTQQLIEDIISQVKKSGLPNVRVKREDGRLEYVFVELEGKTLEVFPRGNGQIVSDKKLTVTDEMLEGEGEWNKKARRYDVEMKTRSGTYRYNFRNLDTLIDLMKEENLIEDGQSGAGEQGTAELVNKYKKDTPGEPNEMIKEGAVTIDSDDDFRKFEHMVEYLMGVSVKYPENFQIFQIEDTLNYRIEHEHGPIATITETDVRNFMGPNVDMEMFIDLARGWGLNITTPEQSHVVGDQGPDDQIVKKIGSAYNESVKRQTPQEYADEYAKKYGINSAMEQMRKNIEEVAKRI